MDNSTLIVIATFLAMLSIALLIFHVWMIRAMRSDSVRACTIISQLTGQLHGLQAQNGRVFKGLEDHLEKKMRTIFSSRRQKTGATGAQTVDLECGLQTVEGSSQTLNDDLPPVPSGPIVAQTVDSPRPPLFYNTRRMGQRSRSLPALSSWNHVVIHIADD